MSMASVPEPAMMKGWPGGQNHTWRIRFRAWSNISIKLGARWLVVAMPIARSTSGVNSMGPGIMSSFLPFIA